MWEGGKGEGGRGKGKGKEREVKVRNTIIDIDYLVCTGNEITTQVPWGYLQLPLNM